MTKIEKFIRASVNINGKVLIAEGWDIQTISNQIKEQLKNELLDYDWYRDDGTLANFPRYILPIEVKRTCVFISSKRKHYQRELDLNKKEKYKDLNIIIKAELVDTREYAYAKPIKKVLRPMEEFNGYTPQDSLDYIKSLINVFETDDERLSDAIKRLQMLIDEAK